MSFPLGRPILAMLVCAICTGAVIALRPKPPRADLTAWVFAEPHARLYRERAAGFERQTGCSVRVDLLATAALDVRLLSLFMAGNDQRGIATVAPDVVEVELGSVGKFFRPRTSDVGFRPLNGFLRRGGWTGRIVTARLATYTKEGQIFGLPNDLHPCTLTYRKDLFDAADVDLEQATTWRQLQAACLRFQQFWLAHGHRRAALGLSTVSADSLLVLLQQRHVQLVDPDGTVHLADPAVASTLAWYARAVAGPQAIGTDFNPAPGQDARDLATGDVCGAITADWAIADLKRDAPGLAGKLHMIPLPSFDVDDVPPDAPTASRGGTMIGIPRSCPRPDLAWRLIETLYLDPAANASRQRTTGILPPLPGEWGDAVYHQRDPFFADQRVTELYIQLARELPAQRLTPYTTAAQGLLAVVLNRAVATAGRSDVDLERACQRWLGDAALYLRRQIAFDHVEGN